MAQSASHRADGSVRVALASQTQGPEFHSQIPRKELRMDLGTWLQSWHWAAGGRAASLAQSVSSRLDERSVSKEQDGQFLRNDNLG